MASVDSIRSLCDQLTSSKTKPTTRNSASATLKALAFEDVNFDALIEAEALPVIVAGLRAGAASDITKNCIAAVWSLSEDGRCHSLLRDAGVVPLLSQLLFSGCVAATFILSCKASVLL